MKLSANDKLEAYLPTSVQRNPRRGCKPPAQGRAAEGSDTQGQTKRTRYAPKGQKQWQKLFCRCFCPIGAHFITLRADPGCHSLRSLALGWKLIAPSGRALNAFFSDETERQRQLRGLFTYKRSTWSAEAPSSCWRNRHRVCSRFASPYFLMPRRSRASA